MELTASINSRLIPQKTLKEKMYSANNGMRFDYFGSMRNIFFAYNSARKQVERLNVVMDESVACLKENLAILHEFENYEDNWNGYDAPRFQRTLIDKVSHLLERLLEQPEIFPIAGGAISFQYGNKKNGRLYMQVSESQEIEVYLSVPNGKREKWNIACDVEEINKAVVDFYGQYLSR